MKPKYAYDIIMLQKRLDATYARIDKLEDHARSLRAQIAEIEARESRRPRDEAEARYARLAERDELDLY